MYKAHRDATLVCTWYTAILAVVVVSTDIKARIPCASYEKRLFPSTRASKVYLARTWYRFFTTRFLPVPFCGCRTPKQDNGS